MTAMPSTMPENPQNSQQPANVEVAAVVQPDLFEGLIGGGSFPSANLMPPAIQARRAVAAAKRKALMMVCAVLAILMGLVLITMVRQNSANAAKMQAQERVDAAMVQKQKYSYVPAVYLAVSSAREELATAMGQEVQVSQLMSGLRALQPQGVSLVSWNATVVPAPDSEMQTTTQTVLPGTGTVTITGESTSMEGIAAWLDRVRANPDYSSPELVKVGTTTDGLYTFEASAQLTDQALSGRYVEATK